MLRKKKIKKCSVCNRTYRRDNCPYCRREQLWEEKEKEKFSITPRIDEELHKYKYPEIKFVKGLYLWGKVRTGKTLLALHLVYEIVKNNFIENEYKSYAFVVTENLLQELRNSYSKDKTQARSEEEIINFYSTVNILILDDIGVKPTNDWSYTILYQIINYRYENKKMTIFTSNCSIKDLSNKMSDHRVVRRIEDMVDKIVHV